jgi:hypothetical protein
MIGEELDKYIQEKVKEVLDKSLFPEYDDIHSDSFSELIDKLIVVHIRLWYLEDAMTMENDPDSMVLLKRKADVTFKQKRPMLVKAIDKTITNMCCGKFNPEIENPKFYTGFNKGEDKK